MNRHLLQKQSFTNVEQLCVHHNELFIRLAYQTIMYREVDVEVLHYYLSLFRQHLSRTEFLAALRASPEAQSCWQSSKVQSLENIDNKLHRTDDLLISRHQQLPDELKELTPYARNIYFQLKSALAIHSSGRVA